VNGTAPATDPNVPPGTDAAAGYRQVSYEHTRTFAALLEHLGASLLVSTYQAGKLALVGASRGTLALSFHNFDRPMGLAIQGDRIAVAARNQIWFLKNNRDVARRLEPTGAHDACYLTRASQVTGEIQAHEMGWAGDELWVVNTLFSCLCTLHADYSFVPRWQPSFITALAAEDRCHLNGLAMDDGRPRFVTALGETDQREGWRAGKVSGGRLIEVPSGRTVASGFAMPHSPRVHRGRVWMLDSGKGQLVRVDPDDGRVDVLAELPGYARGLTLVGNYAFVGLSKIRETSTFGGVPIAERREALKCGVAAVDLGTGEIVGILEFRSGVDEIFDVAALEGVRAAVLRGPFATEDGAATIWTVPEPGRVPEGGRGPCGA
jgi:uncharacterized protein (TIGR03032 family)